MATQEQLIQQEAAELTPAQQVAAATEAVNASADLAKAAGPLAGALVQVFVTTIAAAPDLFAPALTTLLRSRIPLPPPLQTQIRTILRKARATPAKAPSKPRTTSAPRQQAPVVQQQPSKFGKTAMVIGGVAAVGLIASLVWKRMK